jgi:hypothetical protein
MRRPVAFLALLTLTGGVFALPADAGTANVRLAAVNRGGEKVEISGSAINVATGKVTPISAGSAAVLPTGTYVVGSYVSDYPALTVAARRVVIGSSTTVTFDARKGRKVSFDVGDPTVAPVDLAVVPMVTVKGKPKPFIPTAGQGWPAANTYVLPDASAAGVRLGIHGVLARSGDTSPVRYDLAYALAGMPAAVSFATTKAKLARVDLTVATLDTDHSSRMALTAKQKNLAPLTGVPVGVPVLGRQVNYRTPGLQWGSAVAMNSLHNSAFLEEDRKAKKLVYVAGKTYREAWGVGVWAPTPARPAIFSQNGRLTIAGGPPICAFSGAGVTLTSCQVQPQTFSYSLARGGTSLGTGEAVTATIDASRPQWYTAAMTGSRNGEGDLASSVSAKWYFQAGGRYRKETKTAIYTGENQVLPGYIRIVPKGADARNRVPGGAKTAVVMSVLQFGKVKAVTLQYSTDGGKTWKAAKAVRKGSAWVASVPAPKSGAVSLKVAVKGTTGAKVEQTVVNAYGVR